MTEAREDLNSQHRPQEFHKDAAPPIGLGSAPVHCSRRRARSGNLHDLSTVHDVRRRFEIETLAAGSERIRRREKKAWPWCSKEKSVQSRRCSTLRPARPPSAHPASGSVCCTLPRTTPSLVTTCWQTVRDWTGAGGSAFCKPLTTTSRLGDVAALSWPLRSSVMSHPVPVLPSLTRHSRRWPTIWPSATVGPHPMAYLGAAI